jgi:hypothetical protein
MCHYPAQLTFPVPAVIEVTLLAPTVEVDPVKPAPSVIVNVDGYLRITIPEPPVAALPLTAVYAPPAPPPVLATPKFAVTAFRPPI